MLQSTNITRLSLAYITIKSPSAGKNGFLKHGMFVACGIWCLADVSSVSPSSEQTGELWANQCLNSW